MYLGHNIKKRKVNQTSEITRRVGLSWAAFGKLGHVLKIRKIPINLKRKVLEACILPVMTYGMETAALTKNSLRICQRAIERSMLGIYAVCVIKSEMRKFGAELKLQTFSNE